MAFNLEEQEQIASLRAWWDRYGGMLVSALLLVALIVGGYRLWQFYDDSRTAEAAVLFEEIQVARDKKDKEKMRQTVSTLLEQYRRTQYAPLAALRYARDLLDDGDRKNAQAQLEWVIANARDQNLVYISKLRLSGLFIDAKSWDSATKTLEGEIPDFYAPLFEDRRGDIAFAQNNISVARTHWEKAYKEIDKKNSLRSILRMKLQIAGGNPDLLP